MWLTIVITCFCKRIDFCKKMWVIPTQSQKFVKKLTKKHNFSQII